MQLRSTFLTLLGAIAVLAGCSKEKTPPIATPDTDHPDHGKVVFSAEWPGEEPDSYTVVLGGDEATLSGPEAEFPELLDPGTYDYLAYNEPAGIIIFDGSSAAVERESPGRLYSDSGSVVVEKDTHHLVPLDMKPLVRQLNISIEFDGAETGDVEILSAELTGVAHSIDMKTGEVSGSATVAPEFSLDKGLFVASHNLLGVVGESWTLEIEVELPSGETATLISELDEALAGFNSDKTKSLDVELRASNISLGGASLEVIGWQDGEIRGGNREEPVLGTQISLSWPGMDDKIEVIEIYDSRGMLYTSPIEDGKTIGLYNLPDDIYGMSIIYGNRSYEVTLNVRSYDNLTGELTMTDEYNLTKPFHFGLITDMAGTYYVRNDIDCTGTVVEQVGYYTDQQNNEPFSGVIDGGGFKITNLSLAAVNNGGLVALNTGTIKNLEIAKLPTGTLGDQRTVKVMGALCAVNRGTIDNCVNRANVQGQMQIGGLVGINQGTVKNCDNHGEIIGIAQGGGIAGTNAKDATVTDCDNAGNVMGNTKVGGIAGENFGSVSQVTNAGALQTMQSYCGGIVGINDAGTISDAVNNGKIMGNMQYIGGIVGSTQTSGNSVASCVNNGAVTGKQNTGGIAGNGIMTSITGCENTGAVSGAQPTGGIIGGCLASSSVAYCDNRGTVSGTGNWTGGICGNNAASTIDGCINHPTGKVSSTAGYVGGIAGMGGTISSVIQNCLNMAPVSAGTSYVAGIVGHNTGSISGCKNSGEVSHGEYSVWSGGIVAYATMRHTVTACYNTGNIIGFSNMGGIVGQQDILSVVTASYSIGELSGPYILPATTRNGGIVGWNSSSGQVHDSYWSVAELGVAVNDNGNAEQVITGKFAYDSEEPANTVWPTAEMTGWSVTGDGHYWSSLGDPQASTYPTLWWEPSEGVLLIGKDAMPIE